MKVPIHNLDEISICFPAASVMTTRSRGRGRFGSRKPRYGAKRLAAIVETTIKPGEKINFIEQADKGLVIYSLQFEMMNNATRSTCWSFGRPYYAADIWTCDAPSEEKWLRRFGHREVGR
ncbi:hypothetical protein ACVWXN_001492 [Bradyrhizobium sp. i1.4.4]